MKSLRRILPVVVILVAVVLFALSKLKPVPVTVSPVVRGKAIDAVLNYTVQTKGSAGLYAEG